VLSNSLEFGIFALLQTF